MDENSPWKQRNSRNLDKHRFCRTLHTYINRNRKSRLFFSLYSTHIKLRNHYRPLIRPVDASSISIIHRLKAHAALGGDHGKPSWNPMRSEPLSICLLGYKMIWSKWPNANLTSTYRPSFLMLEFVLSSHFTSQMRENLLWFLITCIHQLCMVPHRFSTSAATTTPLSLPAMLI